MTLYLIRAGCPNCGEVADLVEERDVPVPLMQDVGITSRCCPLCGGLVHEWDIHEESEIERVEPIDPSNFETSEKGPGTATGWGSWE